MEAFNGTNPTTEDRNNDDSQQRWRSAIPSGTAETGVRPNLTQSQVVVIAPAIRTRDTHARNETVKSKGTR